MVIDPAEYRWSSYRSKTGVTPQDWLDYDQCFMELDTDSVIRFKKYTEWTNGYIPVEELELIRKSIQRGQLTGNLRFVDEIEQKTNRRVEFRGQGRPRVIGSSHKIPNTGTGTDSEY